MISTNHINSTEISEREKLVLKKNNYNNNLEQVESFKSDIQQSSSEYTLFNKNFTTFMKYTDSNTLDINMIVSESNGGGGNQLKEPDSDDSKMLVKELAATSLTKTKNSIAQIDSNLLSKSFDSMPMKRQNNCLNYKFNQPSLLSPQKMTITPKDLTSTPPTPTIPKDKSQIKLFCSNSSTCSSTCSNFSGSSSSSSRTESNETAKLVSSASSIFSTSSSSQSNTLKAAAQNNILTPFNIENELIKYTKNLKLQNRLYSDRYKLGSHIRNGGFSEIYEGNVINHAEKHVIIKLIPKRKTKNWLMVHNKKYPAEVLLHKMCNKIDGIVEMLEFFEQDNDWIIIMPKVEHCLDLFDYLESKQRGRLDEAEACHFFIQLVHINIDLINHGIVHRDLKSENILVDLDTMKLILIDFGASAICRNRVSVPSGSGTQHQYTDFHGTRQYKPPEYISSKKYTALASTIWTLGILLFDMCNGQLPFETEQEIIEYNLQMKAPVSDEYKILLNDCLNLDPLKRPSLDELLEYPWCVNNLKVDFSKDL